eukprot:gene3950-4495_t
MALELPTLEYGRKRGDMILVYKILNDYIDCDSSIFFMLNTSKTRGHGFKIFKKRSRLQVRKNFFSQRIVNDWNKLRREFDSSSIVQFEKSSLFIYIIIMMRLEKKKMTLQQKFEKLKGNISTNCCRKNAPKNGLRE